MIGRYLRWRLRRNKARLSGAVALLHGLDARVHPEEFKRADAEVRRLRCKRTRIVDLLVAHGGKAGDW